MFVSGTRKLLFFFRTKLFVKTDHLKVSVIYQTSKCQVFSRVCVRDLTGVRAHFCKDISWVLSSDIEHRLLFHLFGLHVTNYSHLTGNLQDIILEGCEVWKKLPGLSDVVNDNVRLCPGCFGASIAGITSSYPSWIWIKPLYFCVVKFEVCINDSYFCLLGYVTVL
jgi:hypothetical protein